jgi:fatty acid desaturase
VIASIILFAFLGATQTNRHKAWMKREQENAVAVGNRFTEEPETAARFGIYTVVIWLVTFAVIAVLVFTVGWWWAPLAFAGGFAVMMLVLARMLFATKR